MCDLFGMAQALIADPALAKKTLNNQTDQVIPCLAHLKVGSCHRCRYVKQKILHLIVLHHPAGTEHIWQVMNTIRKRRSILENVK